MFMLTRTEKGYSYNKEGKWPYVRVYAQPIWWMVTAWLYHYVWEALTWRFFNRVGVWFETHHDKRCNNNCQRASVTRAGVSKVQDICGYMPFTIRQDIRCFELHKRKSVEVSYATGDLIPHNKEK